MSLNLNRTSTKAPTATSLDLALQEAVDTINRFQVRQRVLRSFSQLAGDQSITMPNDFGFQVGGVVVVAANCISTDDIAFAATAHWVQLQDGRIRVTVLGLDAAKQYKVTLEVIERG